MKYNLKNKFRNLVSLTIITALVFSFNTNNVNAQSGDTDNDNNSCVELSNNMRYRTRDITVNNEVSDLQDYLIAEGYMSGSTTGFFGVATQKAVKSFQSANGLINSGYVGPVTRAKIKALSCDTANNYNNSDPSVILGPGNGTISATYYYLNSNKNACSKGIFIGNVGPLISNGQYVYQTGQYKTEAECKSAIQLSSGMMTPGMMCTTEARMCPDGSNMYRDASCGWHPEMCRDQSNTLKVNIASILAVANPSYYGPSDLTAFNITLTGSNFNQIGYLQEEHLVDGQQSITRSQFSIATDNQISFIMKVCQGCKYTSTFNAVDKNGNKSNWMSILIDNTVPSKKISISSATIKEVDSNQVNLMIYGTGFKNGASININGCSAGSVSSLSSNSDTETSAGFDKGYLLGCVNPGTYANVYIGGNGTDNSNTYSVYVPMMSVKPTVSSSFKCYSDGISYPNIQDYKTKCPGISMEYYKVYPGLIYIVRSSTTTDVVLRSIIKSNGGIVTEDNYGARYSNVYFSIPWTKESIRSLFDSLSATNHIDNMGVETYNYNVIN